MSEKKYCGNAKYINTQFGQMMKIGMNKTDVQNIIDRFKEVDGDWVNIVVKEKREKVEGKPTHYLEIDTYVPQQAAQELPTQAEKDFNNDLGF